MTVSIFTIAKRLCEQSDWKLGNLEQQKIAYICHMFYMGEHGKHEPLSGGIFQAWDYGPVDPDLYHLLKIFGSGHVKPESLEFPADIPESHPGTKYPDEAVEFLPRNRLVAITHWEHGAWRKNYVPGLRDIQISNEDILAEFEKRKELASEQR